MKALSDLVAADPAVLAQPAARAAVERMLSDEAVSVRAEAVALLGRHMAGDPSLALSLFDAVYRATGDTGPSVRRAALKTLRDCCAAPRGFARAADAARALLAHAADPEESVRALAAGALGALWFSPALAGVERSPAERAAALAAAAAALHAAAAAAAGAAGALLLPYEDSHALVAALRAALAAAPAADRAAAGRALADALLEAVLDAGGAGACGFGSQGEGDADGAGDDAFPALLALHALAAAEPALAAPPDDPGRFARALAPYAKQAPPSPAGEGPEAAAAARARADRAAEALQCVLAVLASVAGGGGPGAAAAARLDGGAGAGAGLSRDLQALASTHLHVPVISGAV
jgi:cohesin loading factor subunit SCC2